MALQEKVARQQSQLRDAVLKRDATISGLHDMLRKAIATARHVPRITSEHLDAIEQQTTSGLIAELRRQLAAENGGRKKMQRRLGTITAERDRERQERRACEERERELRQELELVELSLSGQLPTGARDDEPGIDLRGTILLYVGGRAHQVPQLRALAERSGASFLHHDGGIEDRSGLLEAQVCRADVVFFPVGCVSHTAVAARISLRWQAIDGLAKLGTDLIGGRNPRDLGAAKGRCTAEAGSRSKPWLEQQRRCHVAVPAVAQANSVDRRAHVAGTNFYGCDQKAHRCGRGHDRSHASSPAGHQVTFSEEKEPISALMARGSRASPIAPARGNRAPQI